MFNCKFIDSILQRSKRKPVEYDFKYVDYHLEKDGKVQYAQWQHPGESNRVFSQEHIDFFRKFIQPGDFVVDIGAQQGDTTVPMAIASGPTGLTLALEPNPYSFKVLRANASLNKDKTNIIPLNFAATAEDGEFVFGSGDPSFGNGGIVGFTHNERRNIRYTFPVTGKNLYRYLLDQHPTILPRLTFIKIDTEGYDKEIIKSIPDLISEHRPFLLVECFGPALKEEKIELFDVLVEKKYVPYRIDEFNSKPPIKLDRKNSAPRETYNILAIPEEKDQPGTFSR